jgi:hypothetical protein
LPPCTDGQDPNTDKCYKYADIESDPSTDYGGKFAFLLLSLWYEVNGTSFGTDFYFRVNGFSVSHGTKFPSVTIRGEDARSVLFNQSLVNLSLDEGMEIEEALKSMAEKMGFSASFCANTNEEPEKKRVFPRNVRYKGVTLDEVIKKVVNSVNGNTLHLPTRDYANKISICTRGEVNQGCSVFYLGRGLYEGYEITGQPELTLLSLNAELPGQANNADPYISAGFKANSYTLGDVTPNKRKKAMEKVKKVAFPKLFEPVSAQVKGMPSATGYVWRDSSGPDVINEEAIKIDSKGINLYGVAPNGTTAISFLNGVVEEASESTGRVLIKTKFFFHVCEKKGSEKCFQRPILQESTGLSSVKVKPRDKVQLSQEIGSSTSEKPEFTRFYIKGHANELITLNPALVWKWAIPEEELKDVQQPGQASPSSGAQGPSGGLVIGRVGSTGSSSGPHLHAEWADRRRITERDVREFVRVPGTVTSPYDDPTRSRHKGVDIGGNNGAPIELINGASVASVGESKCTVENVRTNGCGGGFGNFVVINTPKGQMTLTHLAPQSIPSNIAGMTASGGGGKGDSTIQSSPAANGLNVETGFKGVPRALRIIPGRTILSFITDYNAWVDAGGPNGQANDTDPGVWIPERFKSWFVTQCRYRWREGDLRVEIEGVNAWGSRQIKVPTFTNYLQGMRGTGTISERTSDYYGYIRSIGDLNWKTEDGQDSTQVYCPEAQAYSQALSAGGGDTTSPSNVAGAFPQANCKTGDATKDAIINALYSAGMKTPNAFAGVLGNFQKESGLNFNVHNGSRPGSGCSGTRSSVLGSVGYGLAQWCGSRADDLANRYRCGRNCSLQQQLNFLVYELQSYKGMIGQMNNARSAGDAAIIFRRDFERPSAADAPDRRAAADAIVKQIKCDKPS